MGVVHARLLAVVAAAGLLVAAWGIGGDGSARAAISGATGPLAQAGGGAVLVARDLWPGQSRAGEVTVTNVGDAAGSFALAARDRVDTPPSPGLSGALDLLVQDVTPGREAAVVFGGRLRDLASVALGVLAQGEARRYRFTVSFPAGRAAALDDPYQGASTSVAFAWEASGMSGASPAPPAGRPPTTARPPLAVGAGTTPTAALRARPRQRPPVVAVIVCEARCRATLDATVEVGTARLSLGQVRRSMPAPSRARVTLRLPRRGAAAVARGTALTVRLRLRATIAGRVVVARRAVRVARSAR